MCHGLGLLFGIIAFGALLKIGACAFRRARWHAYGGYGFGGGPGGCGEGGCGPRGRHRFGRGFGRHGWQGRDGDEERGEGGDRDPRQGFGRRFFLRFLFEKLDTTPGQEKVIAEAFEEIKEAVKNAKSEWAASRTRVADAMRGAEFDVEAVGDAWARHDSTFEAVRLKITTTMQRVHEVLDEHQRKILAELIEKGGPFGRWNA